MTVLCAPHRWVCGALGEPDAAEYERLREAIGASSRPIVARRDVVLHARDDLDAWSAPNARGWTWGPPSSIVSIESWRDAVASNTGAGLAIDAKGATLHLDAAGVVPVFVYVADGYLLFASSVDALARSISPPLHVDWGAWSEILATMVVMSLATPFVEISRMAPSSAWHVHAGSLRWEELPWSWVEETSGSRAADEVAAQDIADSLTQAVLAVPADRHIVPLSGGSDSRALAMIAARSDRNTQAVTLLDEFGRDLEVEWAAGVARALSLPHVVLTDLGWASGASLVAPLVEYLTPLHYWMAPLLSWLEEQQGVVLDGLAGDVLLKHTYVPEEDFDNPNADPLRGLIKRYLSTRPRRELLAPGLVDMAWDGAEAVLRTEWQRWSDHPSARNLTVYRTRTLGGISLAPMLAIAAVGAVAAPFTDAAVAHAALRVEPSRRRQNALYHQVLKTLDRRIAGLPSTSTERATQHLRRPPDLTSSSLDEFSRLLNHPTMRELLGSELRGRLAGGRLHGVTDTAGGRRLLHGLALLAKWLTRYRAVLVEEPPFSGLLTHAPSNRPRQGLDNADDPEVVPDPAPLDESWLLPQGLGSALLVQRQVSAAVEAPRVVLTRLTDNSRTSWQRLMDPAALASSGPPPDTLILDGVLTDIRAIEVVLQAVAAWLPAGSRVAASMPFSPPGPPPPESVVRRLELLCTHLDVVKLMVGSTMVRVVGRFLPAGTGRLDPHEATAVYAGIAESLERLHTRDLARVAQLRLETENVSRRLEAERARADTATARSETLARSADSQTLALELAAATEAREKAEAALALARARRIWRVMEVVSRLRREPRRLPLLPVDLVRAVARR